MSHLNRVKRALVGGLLGITFVCFAHAQNTPKGSYPTKPVRVLVGFAPGGGSDLLGRIVAQKLSERLGQPMIVDNRPGGNGVIAMTLAAQSSADGYTLMVLSNSSAVSAAHLTKVSFDVNRAFSPISMIAVQPYVLLVTNSVPATNVKELIAFAKSKNGALNYGSSGHGSSAHLGMELLKHMAKIDMVHIAYKGIGPAFIDLASGQVQTLFASAVSAGNAVRTGKIRAIAVGSLKRAQGLPDLPTVAESGLTGFELTGWFALVGPAHMPSDIVSMLNRELTQSLNAADVKAKLANDGSEASPGTPEELRKTMAREIAMWGKLIADTKLKL